MKKSTIWIIAIVMGIFFLALLFLQAKYFEEVINMRKEQFDESVTRSLYQTARNLELNETKKGLEAQFTNQKGSADSTQAAKGPTAFEARMHTSIPANVPKGLFLDNLNNNSTDESLRDSVKQRYIYQRAMLKEVVYDILYKASNKPLAERIDFPSLDSDLRTELRSNGININYHFRVTTSDGREVYRCPEYSAEGDRYTYRQVLYPNDPSAQKGILYIHFPDMQSFLLSSVKFMIPAIIFTLMLLIVFIFTIWSIFRQKRLTEIKNDFINNMTHEFKTPISTISLAAQMLRDPSVAKSETMFKHISGVIVDETKRLRFQVEKVLQMSMFDRKKSSFKKKHLDLNEMVESIANSFSLRVEHTGGKINVDIGAVDSDIYVDEVNFQNVIFNLMDNAVKYRKTDEPVDIYLKTWNDDKWLYLSVHDTGKGIKKDDLKKIFEKFYRVGTGNVHDVKGFGLGLAYVKKVVDLHDGEIKVDSEYGKGSTFTIKLPVIHDED